MTDKVTTDAQKMQLIKDVYHESNKNIQGIYSEKKRKKIRDRARIARGYVPTKRTSYKEWLSILETRNVFAGAIETPAVKELATA